MKFDFKNFDFKKFFSDKKNIIITALSVVALALVITVICVAAGSANNGANNGAANNGPVEKTYTLSVAVDEGFKTGNTAVMVALVTDADGKIVDVRFDSVQANLATEGRVTTKVEKGEGYTGMAAGSWEKQADAFEYFIIGKTVAEVAALTFVADGADAGLVAGCTMKSSMPTLQQLVVKADAYTRKVTFKTTETVTIGFAADATVSAVKDDDEVVTGAKIACDIAAVAIADGKVVASMLDSLEAKYNWDTENEKYVADSASYKGTKNEQGDAYDSYAPMASGRWYAQAQAFANTAVGKTVAELAGLSTDKIEGSCSIYTGGYKAVIVRAAGNAR